MKKLIQKSQSKSIRYFELLLLMICMMHLSMMANAGTDSALSNIPSVHTGSAPSAYFAKDRRLWVAFVDQGHVYVSISEDLGKTFSRAVKVNKTSEKIYSKGENRAKILVDDEHRVFVSWTKKTDGFYTGEIRFSRSLDAGLSFSEPITVHENLGVMGHRFDSLNINSQGVVSIAWLDKRDKFKAKENGEQYKGISLYYAWSEDHGNSFHKEIKLADHTCECCRIASVTDQKDNLHLLWRHIFDDNIRDHALISINDRQQITGFTRASVDNWKTDACPHHGPAITTGDNDHLYYSWFSQGTNHSGIMFGGYNQQQKKSLDTVIVDGSAQASHPQILMHDQVLIHVWKRFDGDKTHINIRQSRDDGKHWTEVRSLASTQGASDHPALLHTDEHAYLAWQTKDEGLQLIKINNPS